MKRGLFETQVNDAWEIFKKLDLDTERVWFPTYPSHAGAEFRTMSYLELWQTCFRNQYYNFLLVDRAIIQFRVDSFSPLKASYSFLECPFQGLTYSEFIEKELDLSVQEVGNFFQEEYEIYLMSCRVKETITPIRYDYDTTAYTEGLHPASHIHFGFGNEIRVGTLRILKPLSFVLFVLRHCYKQKWQALLGMEYAEIWCKNVREALVEIDGQFLNKLDKLEMMLQ